MRAIEFLTDQYLAKVYNALEIIAVLLIFDNLAGIVDGYITNTLSWIHFCGMVVVLLYAYVFFPKWNERGEERSDS